MSTVAQGFFPYPGLYAKLTCVPLKERILSSPGLLLGCALGSLGFCWPVKCFAHRP